MPVGYRLNVRMGSLQNRLTEMIGGAGQKAGYEAGAKAFQQEMQESYPPEHHEPQPFVSDAQRRGFFYYLRAGLIDVPYIRTDFLKDHWKVKPNGEFFRVENDAPHASLVQGAKQTQYHKRGGWKTPAQIWEEKGDAIRAKIRTAMIAAWFRGK